MPLSLSGTLRDPLGDPLDGARIFFSARTTSEAVLQGVSAEAVTDASGVYSITVEFGYYDIYVQPSSAPYQRTTLARGALIDADLSVTDLNALIIQAQAEDKDRSIIHELRSIAQTAQDAADAAEVSATTATDQADIATTKAGEAASSAVSAADSSATSTSQASIATTQAGEAAASEQAAGEYATTAEQARDAALLSTAIYTSTTDGLANTTNGDYFSTPSGLSDEYLILYLNNSGSAVEQARYPSKLALETLATEVLQLLQQVVATNDLAAQAAREVPDSRLLEQLIQQLGATHDLAGQAAKAVAGGDVLLRGGTAAEPSVSPLGDRDTGLYFPAADAIALAVAGLEALRVDPSGRLGVGTNAPSCLLDVDDDRLRARQPHTPATATDSGNQGDIAWDADYLYVCTATNTWKRAALTSW